jgi:hypothetical protein
MIRAVQPVARRKGAFANGASKQPRNTPHVPKYFTPRTPGTTQIGQVLVCGRCKRVKKTSVVVVVVVVKDDIGGKITKANTHQTKPVGALSKTKPSIEPVFSCIATTGRKPCSNCEVVVYLCGRKIWIRHMTCHDLAVYIDCHLCHRTNCGEAPRPWKE